MNIVFPIIIIVLLIAYLFVMTSIVISINAGISEVVKNLEFLNLKVDVMSRRLKNINSVEVKK